MDSMARHYHLTRTVEAFDQERKGGREGGREGGEGRGGEGRGGEGRGGEGRGGEGRGNYTHWGSNYLHMYMDLKLTAQPANLTQWSIDRQMDGRQTEDGQTRQTVIDWSQTLNFSLMPSTGKQVAADLG